MRHYVEKTSPANDLSTDLMHKIGQMLDEALDDVEQGRIFTLDEAWKEIDAV